MKRLSVLIAFLMTIFCLTGCKTAPDSETKNNKNTEISNEDSEKKKNDEKNDEKAEKNNDTNGEAKVGDFIKVDNLKISVMKGPTAISVSPIIYTLGTNLAVHNTIEEQIASLKKRESDVYFIPSNLYAKLVNSGMDLKPIYSNVGNAVSLLGKSKLRDISELKGKTIALTGRGAVPEMIITKLLESANIKDDEVNLVFLNDPSEAASIIEKNENALLLLPEPFASSLTQKIDSLDYALDINNEWKKAELPQIITSVIVTYSDTYEERKQDMIKFTSLYNKAVDSLKSEPKNYSKNVEMLNIAPAEAAEQAIPNIEFLSLTGKPLNDALNDFFRVLMETNPELIGGKLPNED
ncbi:MAG: ABC transporter substrate-binding protein [Ezakiella sp.]|nr:ABC transporter substrate-binding protein [Ezakiella sp.]MDD7471376.1 ABC transporter substrate-binding protein [Bacillota bacterium]MDY3922873.1 ABC transporter substrate-binding protein [Ezakiella sp.]